MPALFAQVQNATANAAGAAFGGFFLLILLAGLLYLALWLYCLINAATRRDFDTGQRVLWVVVLLFLHGLGPILYLLLARRSV
jgi:hypothetical protein